MATDHIGETLKIAAAQYADDRLKSITPGGAQAREIDARVASGAEVGILVRGINDEDGDKMFATLVLVMPDGLVLQLMQEPLAPPPKTH